MFTVLLLVLPILSYPCRSCTELIARVIEQHARGWNDSVGITRLTSPPLKEEKGTLNIDAAPFIPSNFQCDLPVTNVGEYNIMLSYPV